jgi:hypothetical protein
MRREAPRGKWKREKLLNYIDTRGVSLGDETQNCKEGCPRHPTPSAVLTLISFQI